MTKDHENAIRAAYAALIPGLEALESVLTIPSRDSHLWLGLSIDARKVLETARVMDRAMRREAALAQAAKGTK